MPSATDNYQVEKEQVVVVVTEPQPPAEIYHETFGFFIPFLLKCIGYIGSEFPFKTHPRSMNVAITSLLFYGLASAAEHVTSATRLGPASVSTIVAHSGRIGSLCTLVASVASLFYL
ncbi:unnamed protein product [Lactuca virosa]|uniref:Uncharacterized protein n=1 Tax=Lactuca virosa TaxID=75947 RepID=A0AAU9MFC9_9ASTR|nr:unnamed protein product [Lactuca virosa]